MQTKPYIKIDTRGVLHEKYRVSNYLANSSALMVGETLKDQNLARCIKEFEKTEGYLSSGFKYLDNVILSIKVEPSTDLYHITFSTINNNILKKKYTTDKYKLLVEAANDVIYEIDLQGRFTYANPRASEVSGYSLEECLGMFYLELVREDWRPRLVDFYLNQINRSIKSTYLEFPIITKEGKEVWIGQNAQLLEDEVGVTGVMAIARDITQKHITQRALEQSEEKYRGIIQNLQYGLMEVDLDERVLYANEALCIMTGYTQEELVGEVASEILGDQETKEVLEKEHNKRDGGIASVYQIKLRHKNGSPIWALISGAPMYDIDGNRVGSIGIHMDITEKQKDEDALREARNLLAAQNEELTNNQKYLGAINGFVTKLLDDETLDEISWEIAENVIDEFGFEDCVIYVLNESTEKLEQLAAYGAKLSKGREIANVLEIEIGEGIVGTVAQTGVAEIISDTSKDSRYIVDDIIRYSEIAVPIIADGKVIGVIDSEHSEKNYFTRAHLDTLITIANLAANRLKNAISLQKQREAESELRDSEEKLRKIIESSIDGVISINAEGFITEWNKQAEVIFGFMAEEVVGLALTETIIPENFRAAHDRGMKHYLKTGEGPVLNQKIEISALRRDGTEFPIELAIIPVKTKGVQTFTAFVSDITVQKKVQSEMEKALNKERELNELKSRFVAMTSHEFRTPLTTIKQNTDLISYKLETIASEEFSSFATYFQRIESELGRVTSLMNDILMLGRIESGKIEVKKKKGDFAEFCERIVEKHSNNLDSRSISFKLSGVPQPVSFDQQLFEHVVSNLLSNALKYSHGKKEPEVTLAFNELERVKLHVKDYGIGIPKKDQKGLFQSFYRATNVKNIQGTGLGLSIVKEFTEMHGGKVSVESDTENGTEFIVEVPYK